MDRGHCVAALCAALALAAWAASASGWSAHGHRMITYVAVKGMGQDAPPWLREAAGRHRVAYQSNEADRWRGMRMHPLRHVNNPDHFIDIELLEQYGLRFEALPRLRYEYLGAMAIARHENPERVTHWDAEDDPSRAYEWPGFAPYAVIEHYARLRSSMQTYRILEELNDPARAHQLEMARANVEYHMGMLSHFVGDLSQPLHTTKHFNGWVGDNPEGYTTDRGFHAYIDGGIVEHHGLTYRDLLPGFDADMRIDAEDPWEDILAYILRSFEGVEPLYIMERDGELTEQKGRDFIVERLADGASMLSAMYRAAWESSEPDERDIQAFLRSNNYRPELLPDPPVDPDRIPDRTPRRGLIGGQ